jgi:putative selenium metabolism protein SsnA
MSLIVHGGTVVTSLDPPVVVRADVHVVDGRIATIAPAIAADAPVLDATRCVVVPGNVNAHMHAYSALARGMPYRLDPPRNFLEILQRVWWRLDRALDGPSIRASALVAAREALLAGTTTLIDHHASPNAIGGSLDVLARAFEETGIRSVLAYEVTDRDGPERAAAGVSENAGFIDRIAGGRRRLTRGLVGAHASFTLSDETLADCAALAGRTQTGLHIHVAEDAIDRGSARRLIDAGALDGRSLAAHAVHVDESEAEEVVARRITVAHNPRSNMNNGVGRAPLGWLGNAVALGSDGIGSDMWEEGRVGYLRRREEELDSTPDWPLRLLAAGAAFAGRVFGEPSLGRIEAGAPADLVVLDYLPPAAFDASSLAGHWIFGLSAARVRDVVVAGELVVRDRRLTRVDEGEIAALAAVQSVALWARLDDIEPHAFEPHPAAVGVGGSRWPT